VFETQLDLLYLICGLAFLLVGGLTPILNRRTNRLLPWTWFGMFACCRGIYELLSLPMLHQMMQGHVQISSALLFLSLLFLIEFARVGSITSERPVPWWWIYPPLAGLLLVGKVSGIAGLDDVFFSLSLVGGLWAAWTIFNTTPTSPKGQETLTVIGVIMVLFALASCFVDNSESFIAAAGVPIQLIRTLLGIGLAACLWHLCQIAKIREMDSRAQKIYRQVASGATIGLICIAVVGIVGSSGINYFGSKASSNLLAKNERTVQRLKEIIDNEMEKSDRLVQLMAGSTRVFNALANINDLSLIARANEILDRYSQTEEGYGVCYIMDLKGVTIASSNRSQPDSFVGKNYGFRPYFKQASLGLQGRYFALGVTSKDLGYYTSCPVRNERGAVIGVAVIKRIIRTSGELKNAFDPESLTFLTDPHGIIVLSNQPAEVLHSLWPLEESTLKEVKASGQFGPGPFPPILKQMPVDGKDYQLAGQTMMARTQPILMEGWTLFHFGSIQALPFYRLMGVGAMLAFVLALVGFYVSWDTTSYKVASIAASDPSHGGEFISHQLVQEELRRGELKYQMLANNISLLSEMGDLLQGCKKFQDSVPVIGKYMQRLFPELSGGIYLSSDSNDKFAVAGVWGESPPQEQVFDRDDCWALRRSRPYQVEDTDASLLCQHLPPDVPSSYQCWPIVAQGETLGVFHLRQSRQNGTLPETLAERPKEITQQLLSTVVEQIAMILMNLKLREASRAQRLVPLPRREENLS
jgi:hypothetical protein